MKTQVIIVAGGKGQRMKSDIAKQFLLLNGRPILMHTIEQFTAFSSDITLVLPENDIKIWEDLVQEHQFNTQLNIVKGGAERFNSVKNALDTIPEEGIVLIHDGVRPLVSQKAIQNVIDSTLEEGSAIPVIAIDESIRLVSRIESMPVDRNKYKLVQTPQGFSSNLLKEAYNQEYNIQFTDDASVFESRGYSVSLVKGNKENIKITSPEDLKLAHFLMQK